MVGGPADAVEKARPVIDAFSKEVIHAGDLGAGMALKLARNAAGYVMMAAAHEAMKLAFHSGIDVKILQHVINDTGVLSQAMAPFMFGDPVAYPADGDAGMRRILEHTNHLADKDLDQAIALAEHCNIAVPVIEATRRNFSSVVRLGDADA
jgi:3-hydroxyisobutyrate dehydrogenase-like beta-hydroxyacid dehydrogenase